MLGIEYENCCVAFRVMASDKNLTKYNDLYNSSYTYLNDAWDNMINIENKSRINFEFEVEFLFHPRFFIYHSKALDPLV